MRYFYLLLLVCGLSFAQQQGITYQAVIYNSNGLSLPGQDLSQTVLSNQSVCLQFAIVDASGSVAYQEVTTVTTDAMGMVNLLIGTHTQTGGYVGGFDALDWGAGVHGLEVYLDASGNCSAFELLSDQPFTYVPYALYAPSTAGPKGDVGPQGEPGLAGVDGENGLSAYEIWLDLGHKGSEQDFIESLKIEKEVPASPLSVLGGRCQLYENTEIKGRGQAIQVPEGKTWELLQSYGLTVKTPDGAEASLSLRTQDKAYLSAGTEVYYKGDVSNFDNYLLNFIEYDTSYIQAGVYVNSSIKGSHRAITVPEGKTWEVVLSFHGTRIVKSSNNRDINLGGNSEGERIFLPEGTRVYFDTAASGDTFVFNYIEH